MIPALVLAAACHLNMDSRGVFLPDPAPQCTPGEWEDVTEAQIRAPGFGKRNRTVTDELKNEVFALYGITSHRAGQYEIDHLDSNALGGASTRKNLWPQPASPQPGFHQKDLVEAWATREFLAHRLSLLEAQAAVETWERHLVKVKGKWKAVK